MFKKSFAEYNRIKIRLIIYKIMKDETITNHSIFKTKSENSKKILRVLIEFLFIQKFTTLI